MKKRVTLFLIVVLSSLPVFATQVTAQKTPPYVIPLPGSQMVSPGTTIAFRPGDLVDVRSVTDGLFRVDGTLSGLHSGHAVLSDDQRTIIFKPDLPFALGESVTVHVAAGLMSAAGGTIDGTSFSFQISPQLAPRMPQGTDGVDLSELPQAPAAPVVAANQYTSQYLTLPSSFPSYTVTEPANGTGSGDLFLAPFSIGTGLIPYLLILDNAGQPVYYKQLMINTFETDFKRQPNGLLTYFDGSLQYYLALDSSYTPVDAYQTGNGYHTDIHDLQILPNGHALMLAVDDEPVDMSQIVAGGSPTATVEGLIVQELDSTKNVVFQWRSWDHFNITDTTEPVTGTFVDPVHGNAIELDNDGNLLLSSRHMDEITKIDRQTGDIIWRLGGKNNQFTFVNDLRGFAHQHDIRRLTNGDITLFDDHNGGVPLYSRGLEYALDEVGKTATQVWEFRNTPDTYGFATGNTQRLSNGNSIIGWGTSNDPQMTEVKPDNTKAFELSLQPSYINYRAFRFPWHGYPTTQPTLVAQIGGVTTTLAYSWNGATEIASYKIYGGDAPYPTDLIATQPKTGFEDHTVLVNEYRYCYFRVMPVDNQGHDTQYSNEVYTRQPCFNGKLFLPSLMN